MNTECGLGTVEGAKIELVGGHVSIIDFDIALGVSSGAGIMDDSVVAMEEGWGFSLGVNNKICAFDSCIGINLKPVVGPVIDKVKNFFSGLFG